MIKGKVAIITGSTSGIGLGIARGLAQAGAHIVLNGFGDPTEIERIRTEIEAASGSRVVYNGADMSKPAEIVAMITETHERLGSVDILVNNAGVQKVAPIEEFPVDKWDAIIAINLSAAFHTIRIAVPLMKAKGWGRIVNIASAHALVASPFKSAYVAAKHGMLGLTKTVALEVAEQGITCNAICPGYVWTPLVAGQVKDTAQARGITEEEVIRDVLLGEQPTKRFVTVEELTALTVFLCSEGAASITGIALPVDGGWTAH
jgi:3-hydroxybutyrate dehydrogenase